MTHCNSLHGLQHPELLHLDYITHNPSLCLHGRGRSNSQTTPPSSIGLQCPWCLTAWTTTSWPLLLEVKLKLNTSVFKALDYITHSSRLQWRITPPTAQRDYITHKSQLQLFWTTVPMIPAPEQDHELTWTGVGGRCVCYHGDWDCWWIQHGRCCSQTGFWWFQWAFLRLNIRVLWIIMIIIIMKIIRIIDDVISSHTHTHTHTHTQRAYLRSSFLSEHWQKLHFIKAIKSYLNMYYYLVTHTHTHTHTHTQEAAGLLYNEIISYKWNSTIEILK